MPSTHGKLTKIRVNTTNDISTWCDNSQLTRGADVHDQTGYGKNDHVNTGGLLTGQFTMGGWYDTSASTGTGAILPALVGETVTIDRRIRGDGSGLPKSTFAAVLNNYVESSPLADIVRWTADLTVSDAIDDTAQA